MEQTNKRLDYAISQFEKHNLKYKICNKINGHINVWRNHQITKYLHFMQGLAKIQGIKNKRGIASFIKILKGGFKIMGYNDRKKQFNWQYIKR